MGPPIPGWAWTSPSGHQPVRSRKTRLGGGTTSSTRFSSSPMTVKSWSSPSASDWSLGTTPPTSTGPTAIAFLPDGSTFVSDGYVNTRVVKFDSNGDFVMAWGERGTGPGQFNTPHGIATDQNGRVYVADRSNSRVQVFDENGNFLDVWPNINSPFALQVSSDGYLWVADGATMKMLKYDLTGKLIYAFGTYGLAPGFNWGIHGFHMDTEGNMYWAENVRRPRAEDAAPTRC